MRHLPSNQPLHWGGVIHLYSCQVIVGLSCLVSPEHGLLALQTDLLQLTEPLVPDHLASLDPGCVDEDEPHAGVDDDVTGGQLFAKRLEILRFWT